MEKYVVSARKYRPDLFEKVLGQGHVTQTLKNSILQNKLAHAFLFCGLQIVILLIPDASSAPTSYLMS